MATFEIGKINLMAYLERGPEEELGGVDEDSGAVHNVVAELGHQAHNAPRMAVMSGEGPDERHHMHHMLEWRAQVLESTVQHLLRPGHSHSAAVKSAWYVIQ